MAAERFARITDDSVSWLLGHKQGGGGGRRRGGGPGSAWRVPREAWGNQDSGTPPARPWHRLRLRNQNGRGRTGCVGIGGFAVRNGSAPCQATVDDSTTKLAIPNRGGAILGRNQQPQAACKSRQLSPGPGNKTPTSPPADDLSAARPLLGRRLREKSRPRTETASRRRVPPPRPALTARVAGGPLCLRDKFPGRLRVTVGLLPGRYVGPGKTSGLHRERQYPIMNSCGPAQVLTTWTTGLYRSEGGRSRWAI